MTEIMFFIPCCLVVVVVIATALAFGSWNQLMHQKGE